MKYKRETDKFISFKIAHIRKFNPKTKVSSSRGKTAVGMIWKEKPYILSFQLLKYQINGGKAKNDKDDPKDKLILSLKGGRLNVYRKKLCPHDNGGWKPVIRNASLNPNIEDFLGITKDTHIKRIVLVINYWFKLNKFNARLSAKEVLKNWINPEGEEIKTVRNGSVKTELIKIIYPGLKDLNSKLVPHISSAYSRYLRRECGIKFLIKKCFGADSKKLVKMVCARIDKDSNLNILTDGLCLKGLIPLDLWYPWLEKSSFLEKSHNTNGFKWFRSFFKAHDPAKRSAYFKEIIKDGYNWLHSDTIRMYEQLKDKLTLPANMGNWSETHDYLSKELYKINNPNSEIKYDEKWDKIDEEMIGELKVILPRDTYTIVGWGKENSHCLAGYSNSAAKGDCKILGLYRNNQLLYNAEIRHGEVRQLRGKFNKAADKEHEQQIREFLKEKKLINDYKEVPARDYLGVLVDDPEDIAYVAPELRRNHELAPF